MPLQTWRPTPEDKKLLIELQAKLGVSESDILRLGIRELARAQSSRLEASSQASAEKRSG